MGYYGVLIITGLGLLIGGPLFLVAWGRDQWRLWKDRRR